MERREEGQDEVAAGEMDYGRLLRFAVGRDLSVLPENTTPDDAGDARRSAERKVNACSA